MKGKVEVEGLLRGKKATERRVKHTTSCEETISPKRMVISLKIAHKKIEQKSNFGVKRYE